MYPIFSGLPDEVLLPTSSGAITFGRIPSRSDGVIQLCQLDNERIIVVLKERLGFQSCGKHWLEVP